MKQVVRIAVAALVLLGIAALVELPLRALFAWLAFVCVGAAIGVGLRRPRWLGKRADGTLPLWSYVVWGPWHAVTRAFAWSHRRTHPPPIHEVADGIFVAGWPAAGDVPPGAAIVDATAELPRRVACDAYLCVPAWDHSAPTVEDVDRAVAFVVEQRRLGRPVVIHCAHGRGRSAMIACAAMVALGLVPDTDAAWAAIRARRPVRMSAVQREILASWSRRR